MTTLRVAFYHGLGDSSNFAHQIPLWIRRGDACRVELADSHAWLKAYQGRSVDCLYLDSADVGTPQCEESCLEEAKLASAFLHERSCILIDDTPFNNGATAGKGTLAIPWLVAQGWKVAHAGYQVMLTRKPAPLVTVA
ncbi:MAG TPA: hypothetical protein VEL76_19545 [Gemmataceae bacterium]|nr:hypothetical protein [Gemmataceae bacterium]